MRRIISRSVILTHSLRTYQDNQRIVATRHAVNASAWSILTVSGPPSNGTFIYAETAVAVASTPGITGGILISVALLLLTTIVPNVVSDTVTSAVAGQLA